MKKKIDVDKLTDTLRNHGLKKSTPRLALLNYLRSLDRAVSYHEIEKNANLMLDRVTVYRLLKAFEEHGLVHKTNDLHGNVQYALCASECGHHHHHDMHVHFSCTACMQTFCLNKISIPQVKLPSGYTASEFNYHINGLCAKCS